MAHAIFVVCYFVGTLITIYGGVLLIFAGFTRHWLWGVSMVFVPLVWIVFIVKYPDLVRKPVRYISAGFLIVIVTCIAGWLFAQ